MCSTDFTMFLPVPFINLLWLLSLGVGTSSCTAERRILSIMCIGIEVCVVTKETGGRTHLTTQSDPRSFSQLIQIEQMESLGYLCFIQKTVIHKGLLFTL